MICWSESKNPLLRIQPQRMERVSINPEILILRDIISERDMKALKEMSSSKVIISIAY